MVRQVRLTLVEGEHEQSLPVEVSVGLWAWLDKRTSGHAPHDRRQKTLLLLRWIVASTMTLVTTLLLENAGQVYRHDPKARRPRAWHWRKRGHRRTAR